MLDFKIKRDAKTNSKFIVTSLSGKPLLTTPQLNKSTAFTKDERKAFGLLGKLPPHIETLKQQVERSYEQYLQYKTPIQKNRYLMNMHDKNEVLFYKLLEDHIEEMMPIIYTPTIGEAVKKYSCEFRQPRGLYISYPDLHNIEQILDSRSNPEIDLIVVTDGEGVLGIGDQGIGAIDIPIGKLAVYTVCGGINPLRTLPILLDVGTNNEKLLNDPMYLGWRHKRISSKEYDKFIDEFMRIVKKKFPRVFLHWEDFGRDNAHRNLEIYRDKLCSFNDDIQGTAVVTLAAILAAVTAKKEKLGDQQVIVFGAGTAGVGITEQIYSAMLREGLPEKEARSRFWLIDKDGLVTADTNNLTNEQKIFAHNKTTLKNWQIKNKKHIPLYEVVKHVKPTILIGSSGVAGAFTKQIVQLMAKQIKRPVILPLSNPTERAEATPRDIITWTDNKALIATGSPFSPVKYKNKTITVAQCNNALSFPGIGLGILAVKAKRVSDDMLWAATQALYKHAPIIKNINMPLLPKVVDAKKVAMKIAVAVAKQATAENLAAIKTKPIKELIKAQLWEPKYLPYKKKK
ncbi:MAG: NAD-dependent malic enzyme [Gammaproteobacteria bacterium]|nr:NAD-dependent malic enzyme [Gammaproteobacteria bacterium]